MAPSVRYLILNVSRVFPQPARHQETSDRNSNSEEQRKPASRLYFPRFPLRAGCLHHASWHL